MEFRLQLRFSLLILVSLQTLILGFPDGTSDPTFGTGGLVKTGASSGFVAILPTAFTVAVQADGKIVTSGQDANGNFQTIRYLTNGMQDSSFNAGQVGSGFGSGIALQPDGKIVVAGVDAPAKMNMSSIAFKLNDPANFTVVRYLSTGELDPSFAGGVVRQGMGGAIDAAIQPDSKIVATGSLAIACFSIFATYIDYAVANYRDGNVLLASDVITVT